MYSKNVIWKNILLGQIMTFFRDIKLRNTVNQKIVKLADKTK